MVGLAGIEPAVGFLHPIMSRVLATNSSMSPINLVDEVGIEPTCRSHGVTVRCPTIRASHPKLLYKNILSQILDFFKPPSTVWFLSNIDALSMSRFYSIFLYKIENSILNLLTQDTRYCQITGSYGPVEYPIL